MKNVKDNLSTRVNLLTLAPMEEYAAPKFPTYKDEKPELAKKMPSRWRNKAVIAATVGILGTTALTGCSVIENVMPNYTIYCPDLHHGGAGGGPIYVVHLTEQEALGIIRSQLEEVGLNLTEISPQLGVTINNVYVEDDWGDDAFRMFNNDIEMQLLDEENEIGIALVNRHWGWRLDGECTIDTQARIVQQFLNEHDLNVGVIFRRSLEIDEAWGEDAVWDEERFIYVNGAFEERVDDARVQIENMLIEQIQEFIEQLQEEGIID